MKAEDIDTGVNGQISYTIRNDPTGAFSIADRGIVTVSKVLDRNVQSNYSLKIVATDNGVPRLSSEAILNIIVLGRNDMPPIFDQAEYVFNVSENVKVASNIGRVIASTTAANAVITYAIDEDVGRMFEIDQAGFIKVIQPCDYEMKRMYSISISAYLQHIPSMKATTNVRIHVLDINDNKPVFSQSSVARRIEENMRIGAFVVQVVATDRDSNGNGQISYRLKLIGDKSIPFNIDSQTGEVAVSGVIDREEKDFYKFKIVAEDQGNPRLSSEITVRINITDLNDNAPTLDPRNATIILQKDTSIGFKVASISIVDLDSPENSGPFQCQVFCKDYDIFKVDMVTASTCNVVLQKLLLNVAPDEVNINVRVTDSGSPRQFSESSFKILIVQNSLHPPKISGQRLFFAIIAPPYGTKRIGQLKVTDLDEDDEHQFKITSGNELGYFSIESRSGIIKGDPEQGIYELSVAVTDGKFQEASVIRVVVNEIDRRTRLKSLALNIGNVNPEAFLKKKLIRFAKLVGRISGTSVDKVFVWSIMESPNLNSKRKRRSTSGTLIAVAVKNENGVSNLC